MTLISIEEIDDFMDILMREVAEMQNQYPALNDFMEYLVNNYFESECFPVALQNHFGTIGNRTNNNVEGYNNRLKCFVGASSPNIFKAVEVFQKEQVHAAIIYAKAKSLNARVNKPPVRKYLDIKIFNS